VDHRRGTQITIVLHAFPFEKVGALVKQLRATTGVTDIVIDAADAEGRSELRVVTTETAANLAAQLLASDPELTLTVTSKHRIEMSRAPRAGTTGDAARFTTHHILLAAGAAGVGIPLVAFALLRLRRPR
jgi:hypothetical protein